MHPFARRAAAAFASVGVGAGVGAAAASQGEIATVYGKSMQPTFNAEETSTTTVLLVPQGADDWRRGDVVVLRSPEGEGQERLAKRIVATQREWIFSRGGKLKRVPTEHAWVVSARRAREHPPLSHQLSPTLSRQEGDNAENSNDSNAFGPVPMNLLESRVAAVIWPKPSAVAREIGDGERLLGTSAADAPRVSAPVPSEESARWSVRGRPSVVSVSAQSVKPPATTRASSAGLAADRLGVTDAAGADDVTCGLIVDDLVR